MSRPDPNPGPQSCQSWCAQLGCDDGLTACEPVRSRYPQFAQLIEADEDAALSHQLRRAETIGRPLGDEAFVASLERTSNRPFTPAKRGPKRATGTVGN